MLQEKDGLFYKMVQQVGKTEAASLFETAKRVILEVIIKFASAVCLSQVSVFKVIVGIPLYLRICWLCKAKPSFFECFLVGYAQASKR